MNFLIVTGGHLDEAFVKDLIKKEAFDCLVAADSGMHFFYSNNFMPDIVLGDFDSALKEEVAFYEGQQSVELIRLNPIKDDTDTEYAIRYAIKKGAKNITIVGATGTRLDHVMGNIYLLGIGIEEQVNIQILDKHNRLRMFNKSFIIEKAKQFGNYVSLLPFGGKVKGITIKGMKYLLENYDMGGFNSLGISNEIVDDVAEISFESGYLLVVESKDN